MTGECKLCGLEKHLCESHIVPKFIYRWIKDTSPTSHVRKMSNPNVRVQDGPKKYLLCKECEDKFSKYEKLFAQKHFYPSIEGLNTIVSYGDELFYFVSSVLWRYAITEMPRYESTPCYNALNKCQIQLKKFLSQGDYPVEFDQVFVIFTGEVLGGPSDMKAMNQFFTRVASCQIIYETTGRYCFFYLQIPYFIFVGNIYGLSKTEYNTTISPDGGIFDSRNVINVPDPVNQFIREHLIDYNNFQVSDKQQAIIHNDVLRSVAKGGLDKKGFIARVNDYLRDEE